MNAHARHLIGAVPASLHKRIEAAIDSLIALLDDLDGDTDREPSLGYSPHNHDLALIDLEGEDSDLEIDNEAEPTSIETHGFGFLNPSPDDFG